MTLEVCVDGRRASQKPRVSTREVARDGKKDLRFNAFADKAINLSPRRVVGRFDCGSEISANALLLAPHISSMVEIHPFTFNVVPDPLRESRYRWNVCEGSQIQVRSPHSYATRREAEKEAVKAVARRVEHWRSGV